MFENWRYQSETTFELTNQISRLERHFENQSKAASLFAIFAIQMLYEAYKNHGQSAQGEMEEVAAELREDDEELRVRFRKNSKTEGAHGEADIVVEILPTDSERARSRGSTSDLARERGPSSPEERASLTTVAEETSSNSEEVLSCSKKCENFFAIFINAVFIKDRFQKSQQF